jgi:hypothetical protein
MDAVNDRLKLLFLLGDTTHDEAILKDKYTWPRRLDDSTEPSETVVGFSGNDPRIHPEQHQNWIKSRAAWRNSRPYRYDD